MIVDKLFKKKDDNTVEFEETKTIQYSYEELEKEIMEYNARIVAFTEKLEYFNAKKKDLEDALKLITKTTQIEV